MYFPYRLPSYLIPYLQIATALMLTCATYVHAGVFPNSDDIYGTSAADPYILENGERLLWLNANESSHVIINGGLIDRPSGYDRSPLRLSDNATAVVNGGVLQNNSPFNSAHVFHLEDSSRLVVNGGYFKHTRGGDSLLLATNNSHAEINGGVFYSESNSPIYTWFNGSVTINGGEFSAVRDVNVIKHRSSGTVTINGGVFRGPKGIVMFGNQLSIHGGAFESDLDLTIRRGNVNLYAASASINGEPLTNGLIQEFSGVIDLVYADGVAESLSFVRGNGAFHLTLVVPEPSSICLLGALLGALITNRNRYY